MVVLDNNITQTEAYTLELVCVRPSDYYSSKCLSCILRDPNNTCKYLRIKYSIKNSCKQ